MIEGITNKDTKALIDIYKEAEKDIIAKIADADLSKRSEKEKTLKQIQNILVDLYEPTQESIFKGSEDEYNSAIAEVTNALEKVKVKGGFQLIDPKATNFVIENLSTIQNKALAEVKTVLSDSFLSIKKSLDLTLAASDDIVNSIAKGQVLGKSRSKISTDLINVLRDKKILTPEMELQLKNSRNLKTRSTKTRNQVKDLELELANAKDKNLAEKIKKQIKEKKILSKEIAKQIKENGIAGFEYVDKNGKTRKVGLESYVEGLTRQTLINSRASAVVSTALEMGQDLLKISTHSNPSPMCSPWSGKIISITGKTPGYPTISEALFDGDYKRGGVLHRFCRHSLTVFIDTKIQFN